MAYQKVSAYFKLLVHAIENKDGEVLISRSNGECHAGNNGGVGILESMAILLKVKSKLEWHCIV